VLDDVILCTSELATNAVLHSHSGLPCGTFTVRATISPGRYVRIDVVDDGGPWTPEVSDPTRSHGLNIIRALASTWGIYGEQAHRIVWAVFDWHAS
jgi:anti-sigma regulatory factor (Ser/Thr protein kinase)